MAVVGEVEGSCTVISGPKPGAEVDGCPAEAEVGAGEVDASLASRALSAIALHNQLIPIV